MKKYLLFFLPLSFFVLSLSAQEEPVSPFEGKDIFGSLRARHLGPASTSGRVSSLCAVESDPTTIYVGAAGGGVWKSVSAGSYFDPIFDKHTQSIGKVLVDPNDSKTVWVGTGEPWVRNSVSVGTGVYKSIDGGSTWENKGLTDSERISNMVIDPSNSDIVYVAVQGHLWDANEERGVYKTIDGGDTWERVFFIDENTGAADIAMDPENPKVLYAAMWDHRRFPWSFDSGYKGNSGLYKSVNAGKSWKKIHNGLPDETLGRIAIGVAPSNGNRIYASVEVKDKEKKGLYRSDDAGANWKMVSTEFNTSVRPFYFSRVVVDPKNEDVVYKCGLNLVVSEDGGNIFRTIQSGVHSDIHDVWIDPNNTKHVLIGTDGGVYESYDGSKSYKMFMNLPISQFYRISADDAEPFNVYGGLQDNGSWFAPSSKAGGITNADWTATFGGDGFYSFRHPTDEDIIYCEYQGGNIVRYNKKTKVSKDIKPAPTDKDEKYRFNWNSPIHLSSNNKERMYFGSQYLFKTEDRGESWTIISPDLSTNDPSKLEQSKSGGLSIDNSTAENHCTIYTIAESPADQNTIWVGTDDGNLQVTTSGGGSWNEVAKNIEGLPANTWITDIEASKYNKSRAYVTFDGHRTGDKTTYIYQTDDMGATWTSLATDDIEGYALSVIEDLESENLLFLGTEFGLYVSVDAGKMWSRFTNNMPKVGVREMVMHPRESTLIMGTHGRGAILIDDISPLRQMKEDILDETLVFFDTKKNELQDPSTGGGWFGGAGNYVAGNPNNNAKIVYYMKKRHTFGKMFVEVYNEKNELVKTLPAGKRAGINIVEMPTTLDKPKSAPTNNRMALFGTLFGPNIETGNYKVKVVKGKEAFETNFTLNYDPDSPYPVADRKVQRDYTMKLYDMSQKIGHFHQVMMEIQDGAKKIDNEEMRESLDAIAKKAEDFNGSIVAMGGDFYVDENEMIREKVADLYRRVSGFPGKPSATQVANTDALVGDVAEVEEKFQAILNEDLAAINEQLKAAELSPISHTSFDDYLDDKIAGKSSGGKLLYKHYFKTNLLGSVWCRGVLN